MELHACLGVRRRGVEEPAVLRRRRGAVLGEGKDRVLGRGRGGRTQAEAQRSEEQGRHGVGEWGEWFRKKIVREIGLIKPFTIKPFKKREYSNLADSEDGHRIETGSAPSAALH